MNKKIILTTPHAQCIQKTDKTSKDTCDHDSVYFAQLLEENLRQFDIKVTNIKGTSPRYKLDLNRLESFTHPFHEQLNQKLFQLLDERKAKTTVFAVLDIHTSLLEANIPFEILDMKNSLDNDLIQSIQKELGKNLHIVKGGRENFIVWKCLNNKIPASLFEFNENYSKSEKLIPQIAKGIDEFLKKA